MITVRRAGVASLILAAIACGGQVVDNINLDASSPVQSDGAPTPLPPSTADATPPSPPPSQPDAAPQPPPLPPIACGQQSCDPSTQVCCATQQGLSCTGNGQCQGAPLTCTSAINCPNGEVCCATAQSMSIVTKCTTKCSGGGQQFQLCKDSSECTSPLTCRQVSQGIGICSPPAPDAGPPPPKDAGGPG